nr:retrovirus-related Pol polyprotein from transposon TNT 1-94 [Tanacetum cinerariifolium]
MNRNGDNTRRIVLVETPANALVVTDGMGYDWSYQAEEGPTDSALMAHSSLGSSSSDIEPCLESLEARIVIHQKNEAVFEQDIAFLKYDVKVIDNFITELKNQLEESLKEKNDLKLKLEKFETSFKNLNNLINSQISPKDKTGLGYDGQLNERDLNNIHMNKSDVFESASDSSVNESEDDNNQANDRYKEGKGYHAVPPLYTRNFMPPRPNLSFAGLDDSVFKSAMSETVTSVHKTETSVSKTSKESMEKPKTIRSSAPLIEEWNLIVMMTSNPQYTLRDQGIFDSGCSRHMTGNKSFLTDYQEIDDGFVAFGGSPKRERKAAQSLFEMNQFHQMKGIKREFSVARTPQQNRVAERKNRTLIEAARTMLADSLFPTIFWAEAINIACYVQNKVLVTKPHNKAPYELLIGRSPNLNFMRPFGCSDTILNTLDHLGKFEGKADEGFLVGYSVNIKAFREWEDRMERAATTTSSLEAEQDNDIREVQITATIDGKVKLVSEASIRRHLKLEDFNGISTFPNIGIFEQLALIGASKGYTEVDISLFLTMLVQGPILQGEGLTVPVESHHTPSGAPTTLQPPLSSPSRIPTRQEIEVPQPSSPTHINVVDEVASIGADVRHGGAATIVSSLDAGHGSGNIDKTPSMPHDLPLLRVHTLGNLQQTKEVYSTAFTKLIIKVKKLKKIVKSNEARRRAKIVVSDDEDAAKDSSDLDISLVQQDAERIARVHEEASSFNVEEWEDIQATIEADEELALKIQAEERKKYCKAVKARLLVDLINQRKRHFAQQRAEERRNKPLTQAQQRTYMSNYVKHKGSHTLTIPKIADECSKRAVEEELEQESCKRQKTRESSEPREKEDDELTQEDLQQMVMIVPVEEVYVEALQGPIMQGEGLTVPVESHHTPSGAPTTLQPPLSSPSRIPTRQEIEVPQPSSPTHTNVADEVASIGVDVRHGGVATIVSSLDAGQGSDRVVALKTDLKQTKKVYGAAYTKLIMKVKKLEKTIKTSQARRKAKIVVSDDEEDLEDPSKQERKIDEIDQDPNILLIQHDAEIYG